MLQRVAHSLAAYAFYLCLVQVQSEVRTPGRAAAKYQFNPSITSAGAIGANLSRRGGREILWSRFQTGQKDSR